MLTIQSSRRILARLTLVTAAAALLAFPLAHRVGATEQGDASTNSTTAIQVCEAMGGHADVYVDRSSTYLTVIVECKGGVLDGFNCIFDEGVVDCYQTRLVPIQDFDAPESIDVAPQPEPTREIPDLSADVPIDEMAPVVDEPTGTATPDPIVIDPVDDSVIDQPIVSDGGETAPEPTVDDSGTGGKDELPGFNVDPSLIDPMVDPGTEEPAFL